MSLVSFDLCEGNPGALTFMMSAYHKRPFLAEAGFSRMQRRNIKGSQLYILWNDCCNRDTEKAMHVMVHMPFHVLVDYLDTGCGRGKIISDEEAYKWQYAQSEEDDK